MMLKIKTAWTRNLTNGKKDTMEVEQHFMDVPHYREYQTIMKRRQYQSETLEVTNAITGEKAEVKGETIIFNKN